MKVIFIIVLVLQVLLVGCNNHDSEKLTLNIGRDQAHLPAQKDSLIAMLPAMKADSLDCNADIYWKIIKRGRASIPLLIESLTDTTMTNVYDRCKRGKLNVGEVSCFALKEIAEFPTFLVTHIQFDVITDNCWNFLDYLYNDANKKEYQQMVRKFYDKNVYVFERFPEKELNECRRQYNIEGKLRLKTDL
jgi:hypothetical protein